jgi:hypothetical protein
VRGSSRQDSSIGLVLTGTELHRLRGSPALPALLARAAQVAGVARAAGSPLADTLEAFARAASLRDDLPWLRLPDQAVLIVPRLGALSRVGAFIDEVSGTLRGSAPVEWLAAPR